MQARTALVLGGTRYFGKRLVESLLQEGVRVSLANRGQTPDPFDRRVERLRIDRDDPAAFESGLGKGSWDVVFDQTCYAPSDALDSCRVLRDRVGRYVLTSTASTYATNGSLAESSFDPGTCPIRPGRRAEFDYAEGKRQAEAVFAQQAPFPVAAMRIPIVLGTDDYTGRLRWHLERVKEGRPIVLANLEAETCFIDSAEAASFLLWLAGIPDTGPINACSRGRISIGSILGWIEDRWGRAAIVRPDGEDADRSPFIGAHSRYLDCGRAERLGFPFETLTDWLPRLIAAEAG